MPPSDAALHGALFSDDGSRPSNQPLATSDEEVRPSSRAAPPRAASDPALRIDPATRRAYVNGNELPLTTQLFDLLSFFLDHRGEAVSFEDLAVAVWAYQPNVGDHHFLHTAVYRLRRILNEAGVDDLVDGIRGYGYRVKARELRPAAAPRDDSLAIAVFDPAARDLHVTLVNDAAVRLTGYPAATLTNLREAATRLWDPEERARIDAAVLEALDSGHAETRGSKLNRGDGTVILVDVSLSRLDRPGHGPLCLAEVRSVGGSGP